MTYQQVMKQCQSVSNIYCFDWRKNIYFYHLLIHHENGSVYFTRYTKIFEHWVQASFYAVFIVDQFFIFSITYYMGKISTSRFQRIYTFWDAQYTIWPLSKWYLCVISSFRHQHSYSRLFTSHNCSLFTAIFTYKYISHFIHIHTSCLTCSLIIPTNNFTFTQYIFSHIHPFIPFPSFYSWSFWVRYSNTYIYLVTHFSQHFLIFV